MVKKGAAGFLALLLVLYLGNDVLAAEGTGSIRVTLPGRGGEVALYHVGTWKETGYLLAGVYGGGLIKAEDTLSPALAQWLSEESSAKGSHLLLDADGSAVFSNLLPGLYLIIQTKPQKGYHTIAPFLIQLPYEGRWNIEENPEMEPLASHNPPTGQSADLLACAVTMLLSGIGLAACYAVRKRHV